MSTPAISVVIPTWNRSDVLHLTLRALEKQERLNRRFEVVVVDDGSSDSTFEMLRRADPSGFEMKIVSLGHGGPARARNRGIAQAAADRVLLLGDDIIPASGTLACHLDSAGVSDIGVQGMIGWDPEVGITDVMRFLAPEGPQFWFKGLTSGATVPWPSVASSNLSAPRTWFLQEPFDERFTEASMEDTELAWRWTRRGWRVIFDADARCAHHHRYDDIRRVLARQRNAGRWARSAVRLHVGLLFPVVVRPLLLAPLIAVRGGAKMLLGSDQRAWWWDLRCRLAFTIGFVTGRVSR